MTEAKSGQSVGPFRRIDALLPLSAPATLADHQRWVASAGPHSRDGKFHRRRVEQIRSETNALPETTTFTSEEAYQLLSGLGEVRVFDSYMAGTDRPVKTGSYTLTTNGQDVTFAGEIDGEKYQKVIKGDQQDMAVVRRVTRGKTGKTKTEYSIHPFGKNEAYYVSLRPIPKTYDHDRKRFIELIPNDPNILYGIFPSGDVDYLQTSLQRDLIRRGSTLDKLLFERSYEITEPHQLPATVIKGTRYTHMAEPDGTNMTMFFVEKMRPDGFADTTTWRLRNYSPGGFEKLQRQINEKIRQQPEPRYKPYGYSWLFPVVPRDELRHTRGNKSDAANLASQLVEEVQLGRKLFQDGHREDANVINWDRIPKMMGHLTLLAGLENDFRWNQNFFPPGDPNSEQMKAFRGLVSQTQDRQIIGHPEWWQRIARIAYMPDSFKEFALQQGNIKR